MSALRVLYLEDNPDHVFLVADALQFQFPGSQVESATLLSEALNCLGGRQYDVVLVNCHIHGESILPHLQDVATHSNGAPVIVISGNGDEKSAANAIKHGATDYLVKSRESLEVLPYLIQRLLKKRRSDARPPIASVMAAQPGGGSHSAGAHTVSVEHLVTEIDQVARRIHSIQEGPANETAIQTLREELQQLRQVADHLTESSKSWKSK